MKRPTYVLIALACAVTVVTWAGLRRSGHSQPVAAGATPRQDGPYYLAMGDSITAGVRIFGPSNPGFAPLFLKTLQAHGVKKLLNLACGGESTRSFITGGCPYTSSVPNSYDGYPSGATSQLEASLAFIRAHPGRVRYVTLDIGLNDVYATGSGPTPWCELTAKAVLSAFHQVDTNLYTIFSRVHATLGRTGRIIVLNNYDGYQNVCAKAPTTEASSIFTLNSHIARTAAVFHIPVADVYTAFHGKTTPNPRLCVLTYMCPDGDLHPTPAGHALIAAVLKKTAGD